MFGLAKGGHRMVDEFERYRMDELVRVLGVGELASIQQCPRCDGSGVVLGGWQCSKCYGRLIVPLLAAWHRRHDGDAN